MRIAAMDIGSNGARLLLAEKAKRFGEYRTFLRKRASLRLGEEPFKYGEFRQKSLVSLFKLLHSFKKMMKQEGVEACLVVGTSAFRDARNTSALVREVAESLHFSINVIDGLREGDLIVRGVQRERGHQGKGPYLLVDIGGGSTEIAVVERQKILKSISIDVGTVRLLREGGSLGNERKTLSFLERKMTDTIVPLFGKSHSVEVVGTGGNLRCLGKLKKTILKKENVFSIKRGHLKTIVNTILESSYSDRVHKLGLSENRAEVIVPACQILSAVLRGFSWQRLDLPKVGLVDGALNLLADSLENGRDFYHDNLDISFLNEQLTSPLQSRRRVFPL